MIDIGRDYNYDYGYVYLPLTDEDVEALINLSFSEFIGIYKMSVHTRGEDDENGIFIDIKEFMETYLTAEQYKKVQDYIHLEISKLTDKFIGNYTKSARSV